MPYVIQNIDFLFSLPCTVFETFNLSEEATVFSLESGQTDNVLMVGTDVHWRVYKDERPDAMDEDGIPWLASKGTPRHSCYIPRSKRFAGLTTEQEKIPLSMLVILEDGVAQKISTSSFVESDKIFFFNKNKEVFVFWKCVPRFGIISFTKLIEKLNITQDSAETHTGLRP